MYNTSSTEVIYWSNNRVVGVTSGFRVPANTSISQRIPEDDPRVEVWIVAGAGSISVYVYEGFGK